MKAFEARKGSIKPQYDSAIHDIQRAVGWGWKNTHVDIHGSLYPEVATMLAKDGYDVKIVTINKKIYRKIFLYIFTNKFHYNFNLHFYLNALFYFYS